MIVFLFLVFFVYVMASFDKGGENHVIMEGLTIKNILLSGNKSDPGYFRILKLNINETFLYVGAKNQVIRLNLMNINDTPTILHLVPSETDINNCMRQGKKREPDCQNHIRVVEFVGDNDLLLCGTGAYNPKQYRVNATSLTLYNNTESLTNGKGICPFDPFDRVISLLSRDPKDYNNTRLYTGVYEDFLKREPNIIRQPLFFSSNANRVPIIRTETESDWLNQPHFVGGSDVGEEVLFFFREEGKYCLRNDKHIFSRVAKVCKYDPGFYDMYWQSYQKTRIFCRMPGDHEDLYHIQDIAEVNNVFYALFTKSFETIKASVVCSFTKNEILHSFLGKYRAPCPKNGRVSTSADAESITRRCDVFRNEEQSLNGKYRKENFLMEQELRGSNVFYVKNIIYTDIEIILNRSGHNDMTIFAATNGGEIQEILVQSLDNNSVSKIYNIFDGKDEVRSMLFFREHLYVSSDSAVIQVNIRCAKYVKVEDCRSDSKCTWCWSIGCKPSDDPFCTDNDADINRHRKIEIKTDLKSTSFLEINQTLPNSEVLWYFNGTRIYKKIPNLVLTKEKNLVIKSTDYENEGNYTAVEIMGNRSYVSEIHLSVVDNSPIMRWEKAFKEWGINFENVTKCTGKHKMQC